VHLVIAGGYDPINVENKDYFGELTCLTENLQLNRRKVTFLKSPSDEQKAQLLAHCLALVYTPSNEHFGIVPVEVTGLLYCPSIRFQTMASNQQAMLCGKPVLAVNDGGPLETVVDNETGFLRPADSEQFALAMESLLKNPALRHKMGRDGRQRALRQFSFEAFAKNLNAIVDELL